MAEKPFFVVHSRCKWRSPSFRILIMDSVVAAVLRFLPSVMTAIDRPEMDDVMLETFSLFI